MIILLQSFFRSLKTPSFDESSTKNNAGNRTRSKVEDENPKDHFCIEMKSNYDEENMNCQSDNTVTNPFHVSDSNIDLEDENNLSRTVERK